MAKRIKEYDRWKYLKENEPKIGTPEFQRRFVDNVVEISPEECYLLKEDGSRGRRVCGEIRKKDGKRCLARAGAFTAHPGIGRCLKHDKSKMGRKNWLKMSQEIAKDTTLGKMLISAIDGEVSLNDVSDNIALQQAMILWYVDYVVNRAGSDENKFDKDDIRFLKELNIDMIRSKESASRIKGSMKLDAIHVRQFVDQIMAYLAGRLHQLLDDDKVVVGILRDMAKEVFIPMAATGFIQGDVHALAELQAEKYKPLNPPKERGLRDYSH